MKNLKRVETSKKILIFCDILLVAIIIFTFVICLFNINVDSIVQLDIAVVSLAAAAHSFYYWKAKAENLRKHGESDKIDMNDGGV